MMMVIHMCITPEKSQQNMFIWPPNQHQNAFMKV
ncbi:hypothetical protein X975_08329, partial [Stegodyphus mimosarum]